MSVIGEIKNRINTRERLSFSDWCNIVVVVLLEMLIIPLLVGLFVSIRYNTEASVIQSWWYGFSNKGIVATITLEVLATIAVIGIYYIRAESKERDEKGRTISEIAIHGDSHFQTEAEIKNYYTVSKCEDANRTIYGTIDKEGRKVVSEHVKKPNEKPVNRNIFLCASAGSGKTTAFLVDFIMQYALSGENFFITDPKGELYDKTSQYLEKKGYDVYTFITKKDIMKFSDRFNPLDFLDQNINKMQSLANIVFDLDPDEKTDYFDRGEINLLVALCAYFTNPNFSHPEGSANLSYFYHYLCSNEASRIARELECLPVGAPGYEASRLFINNPSRWEDFMSGLSNRLQKFSAHDCTVMLSASDFEPLDFVGNKAAVYLVMDDHDPTFDSLTRLFFNLFINTISEISDRLPNKIYPDFNMILEETNNIGKINTLDKLISTVRGRKMNTVLTFQNIEQMKATYQDKRESLISACHTQIFFGVNDIATAEYVSKWLCTKTVQTETISRSEGTINPIDVIFRESHRYDDREALLMTPGEIMKEERAFIKTISKDPMLLWPLLYMNHTEAGLLENHLISKRLVKRKRSKKYYEYYELPYLDPKDRIERKKELRKQLHGEDIDELYQKMLNEEITEQPGLDIEPPTPELNPDAADLDRANSFATAPKRQRNSQKKDPTVIAVTTIKDENNNIIEQTVKELKPPDADDEPILSKPRVIGGKEIPRINEKISDDDIM